MSYTNTALVLLPLLSFFMGRGTSAVDRLLSGSTLSRLSYLLLVCLGWKAGLVWAQLPQMLPLLLVGLLSCTLQVLIAMQLSVSLGRERATSLAAHLGSISITTYLAAECFMHHMSTNAVTLAPIALSLELPPVLVAMFMGTRDRTHVGQIIKRSLCHVIQPLLVGLCAAAMYTAMGYASYVLDAMVIAQWLLLSCFLMLAGARARATPVLKGSVLMWALCIALVGGIGAAVLGGQLLLATREELFLLSVLCGSASYIAAPAALRGLGLHDSTDWATAISLGYVFPFNLIIGIPLYWCIASVVS